MSERPTGCRAVGLSLSCSADRTFLLLICCQGAGFFHAATCAPNLESQPGPCADIYIVCTARSTSTLPDTRRNKCTARAMFLSSLRHLRVVGGVVLVDVACLPSLAVVSRREYVYLGLLSVCLSIFSPDQASLSLRGAPPATSLPSYPRALPAVHTTIVRTAAANHSTGIDPTAPARAETAPIREDVRRIQLPCFSGGAQQCGERAVLNLARHVRRMTKVRR